MKIKIYIGMDELDFLTEKEIAGQSLDEIAKRMKAKTIEAVRRELGEETIIIVDIVDKCPRRWVISPDGDTRIIMELATDVSNTFALEC